MAAVGKQTLDFEGGVIDIETSLAERPTIDIFEDVLNPLENLSVPLDTTWGLSKTLYLGNSSLIPTKSYLTIHDRARRARSSKFNSVPIYNAVKAELEKEGVKRSDEQHRILNKFVLEGKLNGLDLSQRRKDELKDLTHKLHKQKEEMKLRIDYLTKTFRCQVANPDIIRCMPNDVLKKLAFNPSGNKSFSNIG